MNTPRSENYTSALLRKRLFLLITLTLLALAACENPQTLHKSRWMMGTVVEITWIGSPSEKGVPAAFAAIQSIDKKMNPDIDSELAMCNAHAGKGPFPVSKPTFHVIQEGRRISKETNGAFDITLGPLIKLWGWNTETPRLPTRAAIRLALKQVGMERFICHPDSLQVELKTGTSLDLGGIAKGFGVDKAAEELRRHNIINFIVNAGGDLYASGHPSGRLWRIGVQDPDHPHKIVATLSLTNRAIATSGDYERFFMKNKIRYHHLLDPKTGYPARGLRSVSVLSDTTMDADALATALFIMGREKAVQWLSSHLKIQGILIDASLHVYASASLKPIITWDKRFKDSIIYF